MRYLTDYLTPALADGWQACPFCGTQQAVQIAGPDEHDNRRDGPGLKVSLRCAACGGHIDAPVGGLMASSAAAQRFTAQHPRWMNEPETFVEHQGQPAMRISLADAAGAARLVIFAHAQTLRVMSAHEE